MRKTETIKKNNRERCSRAVKRGGLWVDPMSYPHMIGK